VQRLIGGALLVLSLGWPPQTMASKTENADQVPVISVSIHDQAEVPEQTLRQAQRTATRLFEHAGIRLEWMECTPNPAGTSVEQLCSDAKYPQHLHLSIVSRSRGLTAATIGISFLSPGGEGCYADIFYEPVLELQGMEKQDLGSMLGHAAAHELGHLLLGTNSHSVQGLMRARWEGPELLQIHNRTLYFSEGQARRMRETLAAQRGSSHQLLGK